MGKRIAMRSYIFGHVLYAEAPLTGTALVEDIARIARSLPGYADWSHPVMLNDPRSLRASQHLAKMQSWLDSGDPILVGEAQRYFQEVAQPKPISVGVAGDADQSLPLDELGDRAAMPGGFGSPRVTKRQKINAGWQEIQQLTERLTHPVEEPDRNATRQAEIEALLAQEHQAHPEEAALAWSIGVYNPLAQVDLVAVGARFLEPEEENWLAIAWMVDWLLVDDELDAIYFTAPPPAFALEQADWYVRPDLTDFLESPMLLREVVQRYPIPVEVLQEVSEEWMQQLGWTGPQRE